MLALSEPNCDIGLNWQNLLLIQCVRAHLCVCVSVCVGYHGAAGGPGVWALAVILLISLLASGSFILYKFKR